MSQQSQPYLEEFFFYLATLSIVEYKLQAHEQRDAMRNEEHLGSASHAKFKDKKLVGEDERHPTKDQMSIEKGGA